MSEWRNTVHFGHYFPLTPSEGQTGRYILILRLRGNETHLVADDCPMQRLAQLGQLAPEAQFILWRTDATNSVKAIASPYKEEVFRQVLQQKRKLQDLELQLQALERETEVWEQETAIVSLTPGLTEELEELEQQLRQNEAELMYRAYWEEQLKAEIDREQDMDRRLHQIHSSVDDHNNQMKEFQARSAHLDQDIQLISQRQAAAAVQQQEEALRPLRQELHNRLQQGEELGATTLETERELQATELILQDRWHLIEELNKELRQCNLQQFIQQTGGPNIDQTNSLPVTEVYLINAGHRLEEECVLRSLKDHPETPSILCVCVCYYTYRPK
ncbi:hypothetical protein INR49_004509 [Caranx melampygus]|nr:hypothetical protein INR49_004509 [Caranx melampygus]